MNWEKLMAAHDAYEAAENSATDALFKLRDAETTRDKALAAYEEAKEEAGWKEGK